MLVLSRYPGESVFIGEQIKITVAEVDEHVARVEVTAMSDLPLTYVHALRPDEPVAIGDGIELMVIELRGRKVRLGITAPRELAIRRGEMAPPVEGVDGQDNRDARGPH